MAFKLFPKTCPPRSHVNQSPHKGTVVALDKSAALQGRKAAGGKDSSSQTRGKRKPVFLITPSTEAMLEITVSSRWPAMEGGFFLQHPCPVQWCSAQMVSFLWRLTKPLLSGAQVPAVKLQVKQLTMLHLCCWESSGREDRERPDVLLLHVLKISFKKHKLQTSSFWDSFYGSSL